MKVFFDGNIFSKQKIGGISRLNFELLKSLSLKKDVDKIFYHGFYIDNYQFKKEWFKKKYGIKKRFFSQYRFVNLLDNLWMNLVYRFCSTPDMIFHALYYRIPKNHQGLVIVHVYDMIQELFGGNKKTIQFKKRAFDNADLIIAISESTKLDLCRLYKIDSQKVVIAYPGVSEIFFEDYSSVQKNISRPYMLYVGARNYEYKNFNLLLDVFINKKYFLKFDLVLFGGEKELNLSHKEVVKKFNNGDWLKQKFGSDEVLAGLYSSATVFIYPSLYEGFGIPPLEAMAMGCPVIASNTSSVPEAVGDAGLLFDPKDPIDLAEKIDQVITDKNLVAKLEVKGKDRSAKFTWDQMADKIYEAYAGLLKSKNL